MGVKSDLYVANGFFLFYCSRAVARHGISVPGAVTGTGRDA